MVHRTGRPVQAKGVSPVLITPFDASGEIDLRSFRRAVDELVGAGVESVMFPGFASEFHLLDPSEKWLLVDDLVRATSGTPVAVIGSVAEAATYLACRSATALVERGATVVNVLPPWIQNPPVAAVLDHVGAVATAVAPVPVILQYAPEATTTRLSVAEIRSVTAAHPNVTSVKVELRSPLPYIRSLVEGESPVASLLGNGGVDLPAALDAGVAGVQPGVGFVEVYQAIWESWMPGDRERAFGLYRRLLPYLTHWTAAGVLLQAGKVLAHRRGHIDSPSCRQPCAQLTDYAYGLTSAFLDEFAAELEPRR